MELLSRAAQVAAEVGFIVWIPSPLASAYAGQGAKELCGIDGKQGAFIEAARAKGIPESEIDRVLSGYIS